MTVTMTMIIVTMAVPSLLMACVEVVRVLEQDVVRAAMCLGAELGIVITLELVSLVQEVQVYKELGHVNTSEYHLRVAHDVLGVCVTRHLQLQTSAVVVSAEGPEVSLVHSLHALQLHHLLVGIRKAMVQLLGRSLHEYSHAVRYQRAH